MTDPYQDNPQMAPDAASQEWFHILLAIFCGIILIFSALLAQLFYHHWSQPTPPPPLTAKEREKKLIPRIGDPKPEYLADHLKAAQSKSPRERMLALRALQYYGTSQAQHLLPFLSDDDLKIRQAAVQIVGNLRYLPAVPKILEVVKEEKKLGHQILGLKALGKIAARRHQRRSVRPVLEYLGHLLDHKNPSLQRYAALTLAEIRGKDAPKRLNTPEEIERYWKNWLQTTSPKKK